MKLAFCGTLYIFFYLEFARQNLRKEYKIVSNFNKFLMELK